MTSPVGSCRICIKSTLSTDEDAEIGHEGIRERGEHRWQKRGVRAAEMMEEWVENLEREVATELY